MFFSSSLIVSNCIEEISQQLNSFAGEDMKAIKFLNLPKKTVKNTTKIYIVSDVHFCSK